MPKKQIVPDPQLTPSFVDVTVASEEAGLRLDSFITRHLHGTSRSQIQKLISEGDVTVNDKPVKKSVALSPGDLVHVNLEVVHERAHPHLQAEDIPLDILYEDDAVVVLNKPAGLVVHPGNGNPQGTLVNALLHHTKELGERFGGDRPGIVHRLDKNTSGVMVAAKTISAHAHLAAQFSAHTVNKKYVGFCIGVPAVPEGLLEFPLGRSVRDPLRRCVIASGKEARTEYTVLTSRPGVSVIRFNLLTGRTHQIRVHCAHFNIPIMSDGLYGGGRDRILQLQPLDRTFVYAVSKCFERHALHAHILGFKHPLTGKKMTFTAPFPADFTAAMALFPELAEQKIAGVKRRNNRQ